MVTAEMKDKVLNILVNDCELERGYTSIPLKEFSERGANYLPHELDGIMNRLQQDGLISNYDGLANGCSNFTSFTVHERAHQKLQRGGYQLEELIVLQQLDKLNEEVKQLKSKFKLEDLANLSSVVGNITSTLTTFLK